MVEAQKWLLSMGVGADVPALAAFFISIAAMVTHIIVCIQASTWGLLIAGALLPPIGVIHGIGLWFGFFH